MTKANYDGYQCNTEIRNSQRREAVVCGISETRLEVDYGGTNH